MLTGGEHSVQADFLFSTVQTLSKPENLRSFSPENFHVLVIDEVHHAGAEEDSSVIPGNSTIHFDRIAKQQIFDSII